MTISCALLVRYCSDRDWLLVFVYVFLTFDLVPRLKDTRLEELCRKFSACMQLPQADSTLSECLRLQLQEWDASRYVENET